MSETPGRGRKASTTGTKTTHSRARYSHVAARSRHLGGGPGDDTDNQMPPRVEFDNYKASYFFL